MAEELPRLVISSGDRIVHRSIGGAAEEYSESDLWEVSSPIPGTRIINTWQIYHKIWLVLALAEDGHYYLFRSINLQKYKLVHEHESKIYGLYFIDDGHAIFCAADGWWATTNAGVTWTKLALTTLPAAAVAVIQLTASKWALVAYGQDHKIYYAEYPGGDFEEVYDATTWTGKWYPAIAGGPVGLLAGAGNQLLRSDGAGEPWDVVQTVPAGVIKSVAVSNQSNLPTFLITVEQEGSEIETLYWSYDIGDSLIPDMSRVGVVASMQSVTPTGIGEIKTIFAVIGRRTAESGSSYRLLGDL